MRVFGGAPTWFASEGGQAFVPEFFECVFEFAFRIIGDWRSRGFLVATVGQAVEAEGIKIGGGDLFFHQRTQNAYFHFCQWEFHTGILTQKLLKGARDSSSFLRFDGAGLAISAD